MPDLTALQSAVADLKAAVDARQAPAPDQSDIDQLTQEIKDVTAELGTPATVSGEAPAVTEAEAAPVTTADAGVTPDVPPAPPQPWTPPQQ